MTSQISTTDTKRKAGVVPFFLFRLKQSWTLILLFTIILFFVFPIFTLMGISSERLSGYFYIESLKKDLVDSWLPMMRILLTFIGCVFSIVVSCKQFSYMKNKVATDFFHSLPQRRGQIYLNRLAVSACALIIPFAVNILLTSAIIGVNGLFTQELVSGMAKMVLDIFVYSTFCLAITTLVGMVTGLTSVTLSLTAVALFIIPASIAVIVLFFSIFCENMWVDFYLSEELLKNYSPAIRFFTDTSPLTGFEIGTMLLVSAVMLVGAYFIYMRRKNERAGTPVVFTALGEVIKYVLIFLATLLVGLIFFSIMSESFVWTVFGMLCGALLTFMLTNTILNKTAKAMFKGIKGLGIYAIVITAGMIVLMSNLFGINTSIPKASATSKVMINFKGDYSGLEFTDKAVIEAVRTLYTEGRLYPAEKEFTLPEYGSVDYTVGSIRVEIVFYPNFGIPVAKSFSINNKYDLIDEFRTILDSEQFSTQYTELIDEYLAAEDGYLALSVSNYTPGQNNNRIWHDYRYYHLNFDDARYNSKVYIDDMRYEYSMEDYAVLELKADAATADFEYFQQAVMGELTIGDSTGYYRKHIAIPIRESAEAVQERLISSGILIQTAEQANERFAELIDKVEVYHLSEAYNETEVNEGNKAVPSMVVTDKEQIRAIIESSSGIALGYDGNYSPFAFNERDYLIIINLPVTESQSTATDISLSENDIERISSENGGKMYYENTHEISMRFRMGATPDFVLEHFE